MSMKSMNKAITTVKSVSRKVAKTVPVLLPVLSIAANVADIVQTQATPAAMLNSFIARYSGVNLQQGRFEPEAALKGVGSLIITGIVGKVVSALV